MDILFCLLLFLLRFIHVLVHPVYVFLARGKKRVVPPIGDDLLQISATDLADRIRRRQISCEEICKAYIQRIREVNPILNAVVEDRFREAVVDARNADAYLRNSSLNEHELEVTKPLLGVPFTVKESCSVEGMKLTAGMIKFSDQRSEADGQAVSRLKTAGAIILLISNTPELCLCFETYNYVTGRTNNPYDTTCTSGGSSGGEAALSAAGASLVGIGSDIAGSIRLPASFNGIFGHKPTPKITSIKGHYPASSDDACSNYLVIGPITRYAKDMRLIMNAVVEPKYKLRLGLNDEVNIDTLKVYFRQDADHWMLPTTQPEIQMAVKEAARHLQSRGATIGEYKFPELREAVQVCGKTIYSMEDIPDPMQGLTTSGELEFVKGLLGRSQFTPHVLAWTKFQKSTLRWLVEDQSGKFEAFKKTIEEKLGSDGILLYPTTPTSAPKHHEGFFTISMSAYTLPANVFGLPATNVPCGFDTKGMPFGLQVIAAPYRDKLCLAVAEELENYFGGWQPKYNL